jgi:mannose-6-phosphate isomerase
VKAPAEIAAARDALVRWLLDHALPIWWRAGADLDGGGFHDTLDAAGRPIPGPKRVRVQARQVFSYRVAGELGWDGPWQRAMDHGLDVLARRFRRPDGLYRALADAGDEAADLYDQGFVLLALAQVHNSPDTAAAALALLESLPREGAGGFAGLDGGELRANPNMHLFEALLAWTETGLPGPWRELAAGQARLAMTRLIDPRTGALSEIFGPAWTPQAERADRRVEPGHQFEWAWLLMRWSLMAGDASALAAALRLVELGEVGGVDPDRNVAVNALDGDLRPTDLGTRLWPQTERLRAHLLAGAITGDPACWNLALKTVAGLWSFLEVPTPGLWRDRVEVADAAAPASSLYHIVGAVRQLDQAAKGAA